MPGWFSSSSNTVRAGDRFVKTGSIYGTQWVVGEVHAYSDLPAHARLLSYPDGSSAMTISVSALLDPAFYRRVQEQR